MNAAISGDELDRLYALLVGQSVVREIEELPRLNVNSGSDPSASEFHARGAESAVAIEDQDLAHFVSLRRSHSFGSLDRGCVFLFVLPFRDSRLLASSPESVTTYTCVT